MDNQIIPNISSKTVRLPEDTVSYLCKIFLSEKDSLAVAIAFSNIYEGISSVFWRKVVKNRSLKISEYYFLSFAPWEKVLKHIKLASTITVFDASHCYWLPAQLLYKTISKMENLEEIIVHDTKISLVHLPDVFKACPKVVKLSFTLTEKTLDLYKEGVMEQDKLNWMRQGFGRLTHLKIFSFNLSDDYCCDSWPVTLGVLRWCTSLCTHLFIEVAYPRDPDLFIYADRWSSHGSYVLKLLASLSIPHLEWICSLMSFVFIARCSRPFYHDFFGLFLSKWYARNITRDLKPLEVNSFERVWFEPVQEEIKDFLDYLRPSFTKSLLSWHEKVDDWFTNLEHLGWFPFSKLEGLSQLKYARGHCENEDGLREFCNSHRLLEHLHFDTMCHDEKYSFGDGKLESLDFLKTLVYRCTSPADIIRHLIGACPNIEALHIGNKDYEDEDYETSSARSVDNLDFLFAIRFPCLTMLTLDGFPLLDGSYLPTIALQCPKLQKLHLGDAGTSSDAFLSQVGKCVAKIPNLRDLRIQWNPREEDTDVAPFLEQLHTCSPNLERLVLYSEKVIQLDLLAFENLIIHLVPHFQNLVLLCLAGFKVNPTVTEDDTNSKYAEVRCHIAQNVLPLQPAFCCYVGSDLPKGNDPDVPRVHYDQIINPIDWYYSPPKFEF